MKTKPPQPAKEFPHFMEHEDIQGISRLVDITACLGFVIKKVHIIMCPILDGYGVMTA